MQATAADSVAVKTPDRMPPRMMTMVTRPQTESSAIFRESRSEIGSPRGKLRFLAITSTSTTRHRPKRSEEHTSELQSHVNLVCRLLLEKKKKIHTRKQKQK